MTATIIDGKAIAADVREQVRRDVEDFHAATGKRPGLATVLVGDDPASAVYVGGKQKACKEAGIAGFDHRLPATASRSEVVELLQHLNADDLVSGILCQLPVPGHLDGTELTSLIRAEKDVDGLTPISAGMLALGQPGLRPCTPAGVMELLARSGAELQGAEAVVIGRSNLFGKPMAQLLLQANATVTVAHSRTRDLPEVCRRADVLIAAVGRPEMVREEWVKPGATVVDVGINRQEDRLVGDVAFDEAVRVAGAITPVPGGVGPMTIAMLLRNTLLAARLQVTGTLPAPEGGRERT
jgi:methylenetetrahydrofolate dehydrogenase (NADP+)/methenyltetrahydrofolate cyclohydrolase